MANIRLFEAQKLRTHWDEEKELWYFSIIDVIQILTGSNNSRRYWSDLKRKLEQEGFSQLYDIIVQLGRVGVAYFYDTFVIPLTIGKIYGNRQHHFEITGGLDLAKKL